MAELRHYRYFVEIARRGTFTAAAEALNMTQSTLSEQILQLERECGSQLFVRSRTGIELTSAGKHLLHQAEALLAQAAQMREGMAAFRDGYRAWLNIASVLGPLQSWMPAALVEFSQLEPNTQLRVRNATTENEIVSGVLSEKLDLGVVSLARPEPEYRRGLTTVVLLEEELTLLAAPGHSLTQLAAVRPEVLAGEPLVAFPDDYNVRRMADAWLEGAGVTPLLAAESGAIEVLVALVGAGAGVAIIPRSLAARGVAAGLRSLRIEGGETPHRYVVAIRPPQGRQAQLVDRLVELMQTHAAAAQQAY